MLWVSNYCGILFTILKNINFVISTLQENTLLSQQFHLCIKNGSYQLLQVFTAVDTWVSVIFNAKKNEGIILFYFLIITSMFSSFCF